jgi:hypothetical protein
MGFCGRWDFRAGCLLIATSSRCDALFDRLIQIFGDSAKNRQALVLITVENATWTLLP